jgi:diaminopimelate decarboxylase
MRQNMNLLPHNKRLNGKGFYIENVDLNTILQYSQTPVYVTSLSSVFERTKIYKKSLESHFQKSNIFYACKANFSQFILKEVLEAKAGIDIVSIGEWRAARQAGFQPENICFAGVGKKDAEWKETILNGIGFINVEHLEELENILSFIKENKKNLSSIPIISLRLNPCLDISTHAHLKTGALDSKFGILFSQFQKWLLNKRQIYSESEYKNWIQPMQGVHVHIGSQLMQKEIFTHTVQAVFDCAHFMHENEIAIYHLDFGGGLGVPDTGVPDNGKDIEDHVNFLCSEIKNQIPNYPKLQNFWGENYENLFVCLEPGRSVVASSTVFLTTVLYTKTNASENHIFNFCYVDGAMNDFPRPSLYGAKHHAEIVNFKLNNDTFAQNENWQIVGPVCESGDFLSKCSSLPVMSKGDTIAFFEAGAYCRSMASQYNLRPLPNEIYIKNSEIVGLSKIT